MEGGDCPVDTIAATGRLQAAPPPGPPASPQGGPVGESEFKAPLEQLLGAVVTLSGAQGAALRLLDSARGELRLVAAVPSQAALEQHMPRVGRECGVCGEALRSNDTCTSVNVCGCARELGCNATGRSRRVFVVPLHHRGASCGVLNLFFPSGRKLPDALSGLLPALGDMLGLALENVRLSQENLHASLMHERQLLASEVHDSLAQNLACMRMRTALLRDAVRQQDQLRAFKYLSEVDDSLTVAHGRVRELITDFRARMDPHGLVHALNDAVANLHGLGGVELDFDNRVHELSLTAEQELQVFHIVREALANIVKHAQARHGRLTFEEHQGGYRVTVEDDGVGLPGDDAHDADHGHFGLNIMRERARRLGGSIEFESRAGHGTCMRLSFPATTVRTEATL